MKSVPDAAAQPKREIKKPPVLFDQTQAIIARLEELLDGSLVTYWNSPGGSICQNDVVGFYETLQSIGRKGRIYLLIKSDGGDGQASLRIVHVLRQFAGQLIALIPLECASAGTMMALGADEIRMGPLAYLTAIDTSIRHNLSPVDVDNRRVSVSQDELTRVVKLWRAQFEGKESSNAYAALFQYVHPLAIGAVDRSSSLSIKLCKEILSYHMKDEDSAEQISRHLNSNYPSHNYPITLREAERIGLKARDLDPQVNELLLKLNGLYSEMGQAAVTDFDELNNHNNEILNILESRDVQVYFQNDKDWHYRKEERRWVSLNDKSSWRKTERVDGEIRSAIFHVR
jgi:ATP-dependent protease ClpP protease subunit